MHVYYFISKSNYIFKIRTINTAFSKHFPKSYTFISYKLFLFIYVCWTQGLIWSGGWGHMFWPSVLFLCSSALAQILAETSSLVRKHLTSLPFYAKYKPYKCTCNSVIWWLLTKKLCVVIIMYLNARMPFEEHNLKSVCSWIYFLRQLFEAFHTWCHVPNQSRAKGQTCLWPMTTNTNILQLMELDYTPARNDKIK